MDGASLLAREGSLGSKVQGAATDETGRMDISERRSEHPACMGQQANTRLYWTKIAPVRASWM